MFQRIAAPLRACVLILAAAPAAYAATEFNVAATLADTRAILASGGQADIVVIGDSLCFEGLGWSSWLPRFGTLMQDHYGDAGAGYQEFHTSTGAHNLGGGPISSSGPNQDAEPHQALNGIWTGLKKAGVYASFEARDSQIELHYRTATESGRFEIRDSAGALLETINANAATVGAAAWSHTFAGADRTLRFESLDAGTISLLGVNNTNNQPGVRVHRGANSGYRTDSYYSRDATFDDQLAMLDTDLVILSLGQNDYYDRATYEWIFPELIERLLLTVDNILVLGTYDSGTGNLPLAWEVQQNTAAAYGLGFLNLGATAGNKQFFLDNGYLYPDHLHHSPAGADYLAQFIFDAFLSGGESAILQADVNLDGAANALDISAFIQRVTSSTYQAEADCNWDAAINALDIAKFIYYVTGGSGSSTIPEPSVAVILLASLALLHRGPHSFRTRG